MRSLAIEAEKRTPLRFWASSIKLTEQTYASRTIELELFNKELKTIQPCKNDAELVAYLADKIKMYKSHAAGFWGATAQDKIRWTSYPDGRNRTASGGTNLVQHPVAFYQGCNNWFTENGWEIDSAGEVLFADGHDVRPNC